MTKDPSIYLLTICDCILRVTEYTQDQDLQAFLEDTKTQDAVIRNLEVIGQAVKDYGIEDLAQDYPDIPWGQIAGMRNVLAHEYLGVDITIVWEVIDKHLPRLDEALRAITKKLKVIPDQ